MKRILKNKKGFVASDALIAVLIIILFSGLIATISYNIYLANSSIKRMSKATEYIVKTFEYIDKENYESVNINGLKDYINQNETIFNITNNQINITSNNTNEVAEFIGNSENPAYTIEINIAYYNKTEGNTDKLDLVKEITMTVKYKLGNKDQEITMKTNKIKEY